MAQPSASGGAGGYRDGVNTTPGTPVAVVGLGHMGGKIAQRLVQAGCPVTVWNRSRDKTVPLAEAGARVAKSPAEAAATADVVITMLADPAALRQVTEGPEGVLAGLRSGATLIEMSTVGPPAIYRLASVLPEGAELIDAPVLGSVTEAESGTLRIFAGGQTEAVRRRMPVLDVLGDPVHVGPIGAGAAAKLVANSTLFGVLGVLGEALALAVGLGLSWETAFEVLSGTPVGQQAQRRRHAVETGDYPYHFGMSLARKDADLIAEAAQAAGVELRVALAARSWLDDAVRAGLADRDYSAVLKHVVAAVHPR